LSKKVFLMILDGWGIGKKDFTDAIFSAKTPFINQLFKTTPNTTLSTFGNAVGLPEGQMGNSEVGHFNIGAGRVVWQQLALINKQFEDGSAASVSEIENLANYCIKNQKPLHLIGLVSNGGVHSSLEHLVYLCNIFTQKGVKEIYIHGFSDGRDTDPHSGQAFFERLKESIKNTNAKIASIIGRYYAMDRDKRWERIAKAYFLLTQKKGQFFESTDQAFDYFYAKNITDEFIEPCFFIENEASNIKENDAVLSFNFRTDRGREITQALTQSDFPEQGMKALKLHYATLTEYDKTYKNVEVVFHSDNLSESLGEVISKQGLKQLRSAETEKYPHVTFFFSGGRETNFEGEERLMVASAKVATYDLQPEMSAPELCQKMLIEIEKETFDFICLNFANADMVGHTGNWEAILKAVETVDNCAKQLVEKGTAHGYQFIIIADHGNSDEARNPDGTPNTAHSKNPVPCFVISDKCKVLLSSGKLADIAPTVLHLMEIKKPSIMTGNDLILS